MMRIGRNNWPLDYRLHWPEGRTTLQHNRDKIYGASSAEHRLFYSLLSLWPHMKRSILPPLSGRCDGPWNLCASLLGWSDICDLRCNMVNPRRRGLKLFFRAGKVWFVALHRQSLGDDTPQKKNLSQTQGDSKLHRIRAFDP